MTTSITIQIAEAPARRSRPSRRHVNIPQADTLTDDWFSIQKDPSASVRLLIQDEVMKHGLADRVTRERFGVPSVQVRGTGNAATPAPTPPAPAQAPVTSPGTAATAQAAPFPFRRGSTRPSSAGPSSATSSPDPRDAEIARLQLENEVYRSMVGPVQQPFLDGFIQDRLGV